MFLVCFLAVVVMYQQLIIRVHKGKYLEHVVKYHYTMINNSCNFDQKKHLTVQKKKEKSIDLGKEDLLRKVESFHI